MKTTNHYQFVKVQYPLLHIKLIGFWNDKIADEIGATFLQEWENSVNLMSGKSFIVIADLSDFTPNTEKVHNIIGQ